MASSAMTSLNSIWDILYSVFQSKSHYTSDFSFPLFLKKKKNKVARVELSQRESVWKGQFLQGWHEKHVTSKNVYLRDKVHSHASHQDKPLLVAKNQKLSRFLTCNTLWHLLRGHHSGGIWRWAEKRKEDNSIWAFPH